MCVSTKRGVLNTGLDNVLKAFLGVQLPPPLMYSPLTLFLGFLSFLLLSLVSLLTIAFFTLFERKVIGVIHSRIGPTKVSFLGLLQPLLDAFKLLSKRSFYSLRSNVVLYSLSPHFGLGMSLLIWVSVPFSYSFFYSSLSLLYFIVLGSILVFAILIAG